MSHPARFIPVCRPVLTSPPPVFRNDMLSLVKPFFELAILRRGPEDLPASLLLMWLCAGGHALLTLVVVAPLYPFGVALIQAGIDLMLLGGFTAMVLASRNLTSRFLQTYTALLGVGLLLGLIMLPLVLDLRMVENPEEVSTFTTVAYLVLLGWLLTAYGRILRSALDLKTSAGGVGVAIIYLMLAAVVGELVYVILVR